MTTPRLEIDLEKIRRNTWVVVTLAAAAGIGVVGVTKAVCGLPEVARSMLEGGATMIADSRLENLRRLRRSAVTIPLLLLRLPGLSQARAVVELADISLNSEPAVIRALGREAERRGKRHGIILMVDVGDLREGLWPDQVLPAVEAISGVPGIDLVGIGTNLACYGGVRPTRENMELLLSVRAKVEARLGRPLSIVSGGNSANLSLLLSGDIPPGINQLRIGEAILLGRNPLDGSRLPHTYQDAFRLVAEVIEVKEKPSRPIGENGRDAFGRVPRFADRGIRRRAILALGRQDLAVDGLRPLEDGLEVLGASSDHLLVDASDRANPLMVGDEVAFLMDYPALLGAMNSAYVAKVPIVAPGLETRGAGRAGELGELLLG